MTTLEASLKLRDQFTAVLKTIDSSLNQTTQTMSAFKKKAAGPAQALQQMATVAASAISKLNSTMRTGLDAVWKIVQSTTERILTLFGNFGNQISSKLNLGGVTSKISSAFSGITSKVSSAFSGLGKIAGSAFTPLLSAAKSFGTGMSSVFDSVVNHAKNFGNNLGNAFKGAKNSFKQFGNDLKSGFSGIKDSTNQATTGVKGFVTALGLMKVAGAAIDVVKGSIDGAIDRFDTLNQFPKMMQAVGFSMDEVNDSRQRLVDGIDGLPTALNEVVPTTQRIAMMTGDLDNATKTTISLNNAFLASGADSAKAAQGLEQYVQMLGRGEVNLTSWRSLMDTMPVALNDVAKAFGYTGKSAQYDLYDSLNKGHVTFDQFNAKLIEMFDTGTEGAKRALIGSEGIKTSFKNIRTAVTNGVEGSIRKLDEMSEAFSGKTIAQHLDSGKDLVRGFFKSINGYTDESGQYIDGFMDKIPGMIDKVRPYLDVLKDAFEDIKEPIGNAISAVKESLAELTGAFGSEASVAGFKGFVDGVTGAIAKLAGFIERHSDVIAKFISMLPKLAAAFVGFKIGKGILTPLLTFGKGLTTVVGATGKLAKGLGGSLLTLFGFGKKGPGGPGSGPGGVDMGAKSITNPLDTFLNTMNGFAKGVTNLALVFGVILLIKQAAQALKEVSEKIPDDLGSLAGKLGVMALALAGMGAFVAVASKLGGKNLGQAIAGLGIVAGLSVNLMIAAEAMKQIDQKVPNSFGDFTTKLGNMAIALLGMGVIVTVAGILANLNPIAAIAGLIAVATFSLELMLAAEAMKQIDEKVPDDFGNFATKLGGMALALVGMGVIVGVAGVLASLNPAAAIAGLVAIAAISLELMLAAEAMKQVDEKVPNDIADFSKKIANMAIAIGAFTGLTIAIGAIMATGFGGAAMIAGLIAVVAVAAELIIMAEAIQQVDAKVPSDFGSVKSKINNLVGVIQFFTESDLGTLGDALKNFISGINTAIVADTVNTLVSVAENLAKIEQIEVSENIAEKIQDLLDVVSILEGRKTFWQSVGDSFKSGFDSSTVSNVSEMVDTMIMLGEQFQRMSLIMFTKTAVERAIEDIQDCINLLTGGNIFVKINELWGSGLDKGTVRNVSEIVDTLIELGEQFKRLSLVMFTQSAVEKAIKDLQECIDLLTGGDLLAKLNKLWGSGLDKGTVRNVSEIVDTLIELGHKFQTLQNVHFSSWAVKRAVEELEKCMNLLTEGDLLKKRKVHNKSLDNVNQAIDTLIEIGEAFKKLELVIFSSKAVKLSIDALKEMIEHLGEAELGQLTKSVINSSEVAKLQESIDSLVQVAEAIRDFPEIDIAAVDAAIESIADVITKMNEFPEVTGVDGLSEMVTTFQTLAEELQSFIDITEASISGLESAASSFERSMQTMQSTTEEAMSAIQEAAKSGMDELVSSVETGMTQAASAAESGKGKIVQAFSGLHGELRAAGQHAMSGLTAGIQAGAGSAIAAAQSVASKVASTVRKALDINSPSRVMMAIGGFVSEGLANGILAAQNMVQKASDALAMATIPNNLATVSASGVITSNVHVDDEDISRIKASASQTIVVQHKQVVPQVTVNVENNGGNPPDIDEIVERVEEVIIDALDADLS